MSRRIQTKPASFSMDEALALRDEGMTQQEAARHLGVSVSTLYKWLRRCGERWGPTRWRNLTGRVNTCLFEMGITQTQAAEDLGTKGPAITDLGNNKRVLLADGRTFSGPAKRLAKYLDLPPEWLWADLQEQFGTHPKVKPAGLLLDAPDTSPSVEERYAHEAELRRLPSALDEVLTERQRFVIRERFGLPGAQEEGKGKSLSQVGKMMGLSHERVRQIEREATIRLRDHGGIRDELWLLDGEGFVDAGQRRMGAREPAPAPKPPRLAKPQPVPPPPAPPRVPVKDLPKWSPVRRKKSARRRKRPPRRRMSDADAALGRLLYYAYADSYRWDTKITWAEAEAKHDVSSWKLEGARARHLARKWAQIESMCWPPCWMETPRSERDAPQDARHSSGRS